MRVRIHLNLAKPELAENAVRIQGPSGAWITVGYSTQLVLQNCVPVVDSVAQEKVRDGKTRKVPHAFIEGDLVHFKGRPRLKAPPALAAKAKPFLAESAEFGARHAFASSQGRKINYNPRFASCFYGDAPSKAEVSEKFLGSDEMVVVGWAFGALAPRFAPMTPGDRCAPSALAKTSLSEKLGIARGRETTARMEGAPVLTPEAARQKVRVR